MNRPGQPLLAKLNFSKATTDTAGYRNIPLAAKTILKMLGHLSAGHLSIGLPNGEIQYFGNPTAPLHAEIHVLDWSLFRDVLRHGDIGFAESYIRGKWETPNLKLLLELAIRNRTILEKAIYGSWAGSLAYRFKHWLRRNSKAGSRKNIHAHYDLGNDFYSLWLDETMSYSSGFFASSDQSSLAQAQNAKYQHILNSLECKAGDSVLEIGCGWGGFMEVATRAGLNITGLTLSTEQAKFALERIAKLTHAPTLNANQTRHHPITHSVRLQDYRDCHDQFDGIASIEMFEAVGESHWPEYFQSIAACLKPNGKACVQTIVIAVELFERYRNSTDFIQQYVFPGGMLPSRDAFIIQANLAGLQIDSELSFGKDYAKTLEIWFEQFNAKLPEVRQLGFDEAFIRLWNFYLMYCAAGFSEQNIDVVQFTLSHRPTKKYMQ